MRLSTKKLQDMLNIAVKGSSNNKMIPLSSLLCIQVKDGFLTLTTSDGVNYLKVSEKIQEIGEFYCTVPTGIFSKLVAKLNTDMVELIIKEQILEVHANGKYSIELPLDETGSIIKYPDKFLNIDTFNKVTNIKLLDIKTILNTNKHSLALTLEQPCLTAYWCGDKVLSTDSYKLCKSNINMFEEPTLISSETMDLLGLVTDEEIEVYLKDNEYIYKSSNISIFAPEPYGLSEYPVETLGTLLSKNFESIIQVNKLQLLDSLDRLSLLVSTQDNNVVDITISENELTISNKEMRGSERLEIKGTNIVPHSFSININTLMSQVKAIDNEAITIEYAQDWFIKLVTDTTVQVIALIVKN